MEEKVATLKRELLALQTREALLGVDDYQAVVRLRLVESFASKASRWLLNVDKYAEFHQPSLLVKTKKTSELQDFAAVLHDLHLISSPDGANLSELDVLFKAIRDGHREEWPLVDDSVLLEESFFDGLKTHLKKPCTRWSKRVDSSTPKSATSLCLAFLECAHTSLKVCVES